MSNLLRDLTDGTSPAAITVRKGALSALEVSGPEWKPVATVLATAAPSSWGGESGLSGFLRTEDANSEPGGWQVTPSREELRSPNIYSLTVYTAWIVDQPKFGQLLWGRSLDVDTTPNPGEVRDLEELIRGRLTMELSERVPEQEASEDPVASILEAASDEYGPVAVEAVARLLKDARTSFEARERLIRALGFVRTGAAVDLASDLLAIAIRDENVHIRDAAVSAMGFGADPERSSKELRAAAASESVPLLRTVMLQSAEQLEAWGRRRAAIAQDRTKEVDRHRA